jgi:hypothetical protein
MSWRTTRPRTSSAFLQVMCCAAVCLGLAAMIPASASAAARDFCVNVKLGPGGTCGDYGSAESSYGETESWNSSGEGVGSCAGVNDEGVPAWSCTGDASGYDEAYCTGSCANHPGWAVAHDHSATKSSNFTSWGSYSGSDIVSLDTATGLGAAPPALTPYGPPEPVSPTTPRLMISQVDAAEASAFGVMRRPLASSDVVPIDQLISFSASSGANPSLARRVLPGAPQGQVSGAAWLVPGDGKVCLISISRSSRALGGAGCLIDEAAITGKLIVESTSTEAGGGALVAGLVPDGVPTVTLTSGGRTWSVPVKENVYMAEVSGWVSNASFVGPAGPVNLVMPEP